LRRQVADPLGGLWESDILPLLVTRPGVRPVTVLEEMQRGHPDRDWHRLRRTLERRVRAWCAEHGAEREVIFRQDHPPGQQGLSDFTDMADLGIHIAGELLAHRLYHFVLAYSSTARQRFSRCSSRWSTCREAHHRPRYHRATACSATKATSADCSTGQQHRGDWTR
jgi:hypothetical protein